MATRQIAVSTFWQLSSQLLMAAMSILTMKFLSLALSKSSAGIYNSSYGYLQLFAILADFGLYAVSVKELSRASDKQSVLSALILIRLSIVVLSFGSALFIVWLMPTWRGTPLPMGVTLAALVPVFTLCAGTLRTVFQTHFTMHWVFVAEVVHRILTTGLIVGTIVWFQLNDSADIRFCYLFLFFGGVGSLFLFGLHWVLGARYIPLRLRTNHTVILRLLRTAAPYGIAYFCLALYRQFDVTMIALLRTDFEIQNAYYGFVLRASDMAFILPTFLLNSTLPVLSESEASGHATASLLGKTLLLILLLGSICSLFSVFWARPLMQLLTSEAYLSTGALLGSDSALQVMSPSMLLNGLVLYGFYVLLTKHRWRQLVLTLFFGALLSLSLNYLLIPVQGFFGAALTLTIVHIVLAALLLPQGLRAMPVRLPENGIVQWLVFTVCLAAVLWIFRPFVTTEWRTIVGGGVVAVYMVVLFSLLRMKRTLVHAQ